MKDSWNGEIFFSTSAYELKNLLMSSTYAWRILICDKNETYSGKNLYSCINMENDLVHMDIEGKLYFMGLLIPNKSGSSKLFYCSKSIYRTKEEFLEDFEENYGGDVHDVHYETEYGWIMDEDDTNLSKQFCIDIMKGVRL